MSSRVPRRGLTETASGSSPATRTESLTTSSGSKPVGKLKPIRTVPLRPSMTLAFARIMEPHLPQLCYITILRCRDSLSRPKPGDPCGRCGSEPGERLAGPGSSHVVGARPPCGFLEIEIDGLSFLERLERQPLEARTMEEHLPAVLAADETESPVSDDLLDRTSAHTQAPFSPRLVARTMLGRC